MSFARFSVTTVDSAMGFAVVEVVGASKSGLAAAC
jgi:hypothetical protein